MKLNGKKNCLTLELVRGFTLLAMKTKVPIRGVWRVGELAEAAGVSPDTLRHYERKGLLRPERSSNGYREYPERALERVRMIRQALLVGFTLDELSKVFRVFDRGGAPCQEVRGLAAAKLVEIESHLQDVIAMRNELRASLKDWDARLAKTATGQRAGLLKALAARDSVLHSSNSFLLRKPKMKLKGKKK
jgi:DNA-binding transcriptional MerR regulator